jgi:hypothetical protein
MVVPYIITAPDGTEHQILASSPRRAIQHIITGARYPTNQDYAAPRWQVRYARFEERPVWHFVE